MPEFLDIHLNVLSLDSGDTSGVRNIRSNNISLIGLKRNDINLIVLGFNNIRLSMCTLDLRVYEQSLMTADDLGGQNLKGLTISQKRQQV